MVPLPGDGEQATWWDEGDVDKTALKAWRLRQRLTQKELAHLLGVTPMCVAFWEWGKRRIPPFLPLALEALEYRLTKRKAIGLLVECPECKRRNSAKEKTCKKCGFASKFSGRSWWIEYYYHEKRLRRERLGPNKHTAEIKLLEIKKALVEGRYLRKNPEVRTTFRELATWYLNLAEVQAKRSYRRDRQLVDNLLTFFGLRLLWYITPLPWWKPIGRSDYKNLRPAPAAPGGT